MAKRRRLQNNEANLDELGNDPGQVGPDSAGQSGDTQGLSREAEASDQDVDELSETDQAYEAGIVEGVEEAGDHPEEPVRSHEDGLRKNPIELSF
jgi:hypothetical protein